MPQEEEREGKESCSEDAWACLFLDRNFRSNGQFSLKLRFSRERKDWKKTEKKLKEQERKNKDKLFVYRFNICSVFLKVHFTMLLFHSLPPSLTFFHFSGELSSLFHVKFEHKLPEKNSKFFWTEKNFCYKKNFEFFFSLKIINGC